MGKMHAHCRIEMNEKLPLHFKCSLKRMWANVVFSQRTTTISMKGQRELMYVNMCDCSFSLNSHMDVVII